MMNESHSKFMKEALIEARKALLKDEVPVGAVIALDGVIISRSHNTKQSSNKISRHAEINALELASDVLGHWNLEGASLYVTLEPCIMCSAAIIDSRIKTVYYGAKEPKTGGHLSKAMIFDLPNQYHVDVYGGILEEESKELLKEFFEKRRH
jgi:tRNA(adenine34) deaminase